MYIQEKNLKRFLAFLLMLWLISGVSPQAIAKEESNASSGQENLFEMSLEELMNVEVSGSGSLTKTTRRKVPATVTTLTKDDIQRTGARSLDELLLITVPNLQKQVHRNEFEHIGLRGIIGDVDDKYLLLVNGKLMNERYYYGAMAERDLPMLSDIHHIDVVRGPGSALYGPGAMGMVINIVTESALTFEGLETTNRMGMIEEFYSSELKYGHRFSDDHGVYLYGGVSKYPGADGHDASRVYSRSDGKLQYDETAGGNKAFHGRPKAKVHFQYNRGGLETWLRYTQGGKNRYSFINGASAGDAYQKITGQISNRYEISPTVAITPSFGFDIYEHDERYSDTDISSWRRDEYKTKLTLDWTPNEKHQVTVGGEWSHAVNNLRGFGEPDLPSRFSQSRGFGDRPFFTDLTSVFAEHQWRMTEDLTSFLGGRVDWHNYMPGYVFSPRAALVWTPTKKDTIKLMYTKSTRLGNDSTLRQGYLQHAADSSASDQTDVETLEAYELRYERQHTQKLWLASSLFYHIHNPIGWGGSAETTLGEMKSVGIELEAAYRTDRMRIIFSHSYTKLLSYKQGKDVEWTALSAAGNGYGMNYANWDNHVSKLRAEYDVTKKVSVDGSVQVLWGSPGKEDFADWRREALAQNDKHIYKGAIFLNLGAQYKATENLLIRFDAYNILGFFDRDINALKSLSEQGHDDINTEEYNTVAPAFGVSVTYKF